MPSQALTFARPQRTSQPVLVNGSAGVVSVEDGRPMSVTAFTIVEGRITEIDRLADPDRMRRVELTSLQG